jgi:hypothetical protein
MMTPLQMQQAAHHAELTAVAHALTADERAQFLAKTSRWPGMDGAEVADILDLTTDHDEFLDQTEAFFMAHDADMPDGLNYAPLFAAHALIILGRPLTVRAVCALLVKAGCMDAPDYDPTHDLAVVLSILGRRGDANPVIQRAVASLRVHLDTSTAETAEAGLRTLYGKDD